MKSFLFPFISILLILKSGYGQDIFSERDPPIQDEGTTLKTIALYPEHVRHSIVEVCKYPDALTGIGVLQKNSRERFSALLAPFDKKDQQMLWDVTRYPGLVDSIAKPDKPSKKGLEKMIQTFPAEIHEAAIHVGTKHRDVIRNIQELNSKRDEEFRLFLSDYPVETQKGLEEIVKYPEVMELLSGNMEMTVLIGYLQKKDPEKLESRLDSLQLAAANEKAGELSDWQRGLDANPQAKKEFEEAAKKYAKNQGYDDRDFGPVESTIVVNFVCYPYPYWYGPPSWWHHPHWYPYPYWYDWGFYYSPHGIIFIECPSWHFMYWYMFYSHNHIHYPYFTDYCLEHYYGHRGSNSNVGRSVSQWISENESRFPPGYLSSDVSRPERLKEFGRFERDYEISGSKISKDEYLKNNAQTYPNLSGGNGKEKFPATGPGARKYEVQPHEYPPVKVPRRSEEPKQRQQDTNKRTPTSPAMRKH